MSEIAELYRSENYSHRVAAEVRSHAARQGILQKDLAKALGYVPSQITKRMRGQVAFTLDELAVLAQLFGIEPGDLMPKAGRPAIADRPATSALPQLDLNQQPFGSMYAQVTALRPHQDYPPLRLVPSLPAETMPAVPRTVEPFPVTRPDVGQPSRPLIIRCLAGVS